MRRLAVLLLLIFLPLAGARGERVNDLYFALAYTTGTEEPERSRGFRDALRDVVVKLTGDHRLARSETIDTLLKRPHDLVERFEYEDRMKGIPVHDEQGTRERPHFLRIWFKREAMDSSLKALGLKAWGADRPVIAVWLAIRTDASAYVLLSDGPRGYGQRSVFESTAARRGLPVRLPDAAGAITVDDIDVGNMQKLRSASTGADALLVGTLTLAKGGTWNFHWSLHGPEPVEAWGGNRVSFDTAIRSGLQRAALVLSAATKP